MVVLENGVLRTVVLLAGQLISGERSALVPGRQGGVGDRLAVRRETPHRPGDLGVVAHVRRKLALLELEVDRPAGLVDQVVENPLLVVALAFLSDAHGALPWRRRYFTQLARGRTGAAKPPSIDGCEEDSIR